MRLSSLIIMVLFQATLNTVFRHVCAISHTYFHIVRLNIFHVTFLNTWSSTVLW